MACNIADEDLYKFAKKLEGKTVLITGGASGIGKAAVLEFARWKANIVIGDINTKGSEELANEINRSGGNAVYKSCNVLEFDDQRSLFEYAIKKFGIVDVVIANAGISESGGLISRIELNELGLPMKPNLKTVEMNFLSVVYTAQLATHYLDKSFKKDSTSALVLIGSILSFTSLSSAPLYCSSKHAVLSLMRSLASEYQTSSLRIASVHPWFVDTPLVPQQMKNLLLGIPLSPLERVVGAIVLAATDSTPEMNGGAYTIPDEREVFVIPHTEINENVYTLLSNRAKNDKGWRQNAISTVAFAKYFAGTRFAKGVMYGAISCSLWVLSSRAILYVKAT